MHLDNVMHSDIKYHITLCITIFSVTDIMWRIFHIILSIPENVVMHLINNVIIRSDIKYHMTLMINTIISM